MFILENNNIRLQPLTRAAIDDRILWNTVVTDWKKLENPDYQDTGFCVEEYRRKKELEIINKTRIIEGIYTALEIYTSDDTHIGFINCYPYPNGDWRERTAAIGIIIPEKEYRSCGWGTSALKLYSDYLFQSGFYQLYIITQKWNFLMIQAAQKCLYFSPKSSFEDSPQIVLSRKNDLGNV